jgi:hypothetical protein
VIVAPSHLPFVDNATAGFRSHWIFGSEMLDQKIVIAFVYRDRFGVA